ncbi:MAG: hypothetical protein IPN88_19255 [Bacteroidetes bacterium]|nr:hypothetical protein [Bacteroidota bacterium]
MTVTDVNGCTSIAATTVLQAIPLTVSVASVPTICIGQTTNLAADIAVVHHLIQFYEYSRYSTH